MVRLQIEQIFFNAENPPIPILQSHIQNDEPLSSFATLTQSYENL